jgi:hypothetical protein
MQIFVVFESDGVDAAHFPPRHAFLVGPEEVPLQGSIELSPSMVRCEKQAPQTSGLAVQVQVPRAKLPESLAKHFPAPGGDSMGLLTVHTCLLPDREHPYLLMIELARRQIMLLLNKLEDWQLTDLPSDHPVMQQFELARSSFCDALVAQRGADGAPDRGGYRAQANQLSAQALALSMEAGEELALIHAERQMRQRLSGEGYKSAHAQAVRASRERPAANAPAIVPGAGQVVLPGIAAIGCAVSPGPVTESQTKAIMASCDFVTMPMRWIDMEPVEGKYNFTPTDRWIEWAVRVAKLPIVGGPLIDFRPRCAPEWLFIWENDYETLRDLVFEHVQALVTRYRKTISRWTVASGLHVNTNFKISFEQIMDLTRICVMLVKKLHPSAKVQLEVAQPWGEYHTTNRRSIPPYLYAEAALTAGLPIDAIALRVQMGHAEPGTSTRDMLSFSAMLDKFAQLEKPIVISAIGAPSQPVTPKPFIPRAGAEPDDPYEPGYWRQPWSETTQALWMTQALTIALAKPYVHSVCWQELSDSTSNAPPEMPSGGLMKADGATKPALMRLAQIRTAMREGKSPSILLKK